MARRRRITAFLLVGAVVAIACVALVWKPRIGSVEPATAASFSTETLRRGGDLAAIGNCEVCHTAPGGKTYAGSRALETPFGVIFSSNITPDVDTGIGRWSEAAFRRALRDGVDREGRHLYPAFPYDHFTQLTDADIHAIYAFIITRDPVRSVPPKNKLRFPFNVRPLLAGWKLLFLRSGPRSADAAQNADWNKGAYLVEGVAHCGACHTPRNLLGAEQPSRAFAGGESEGWDAPALDSSSRAPTPWSVDQLTTYLRSGWQAQHGAAAGPMAPVTQNLAHIAESDVRAIATYIASLSQNRTSRAVAKPAEATPQTSTTAAIYAGACGNCHDSPAGSASLGLPLSTSTSLRESRPRNTLNVILHGIARSAGEPGPYMPAFDGTLTDAQIAELTAYIRERFSGEPAWGNIPDDLGKVRKGDPS